MRHALFLPPFNELADPTAMVDIARTAEETGWDGLFLWDHVLRPREESLDIADPWIVLAAVAARTSTLRLGTMVTPITRRRPHKLAREAATLDHLSGGRVILGLGLGVDGGRELTAFGEIVDPKIRGQRLDEGAELLDRLWTGEAVTFHGRHFTADDVMVRPVPVQQPRIPMWFAARGDARAPVRRAARYDGLFPIEVDADRYRRMIDLVVAERGSLDGFDIAVEVEPGHPAPAWADGTATWLLQGFRPRATRGDVSALAAAGPPR